MIDRYCRPEMKALWSEHAKYESWARVEKAHLSCLVERKQAPAQVIDCFEKAFKQKTIDDFLLKEQETGHDVIAFISEIANAMGDTGHFLHKGLTSSDVVDTAFALRIQASFNIILNALQKVRRNLAARAFEQAHTICMGRTHGIHAEPMSFGQILASHFAEFQRAHADVLRAQKNLAFGKLSGAVGTYSQMPPDFEQDVLTKLDLNVEPVATQVIPRDRITTLAKALLSVSNAIERFALNLRHWARTELGEVLEPFGKKQKGSSAMPHKKNPILSENLCGLARVMRGLFNMINENSALWHERDISHSSVERMAIPDLFATCDFMLARTATLVENMEVNPQAMLANVWKTGGLWASQSVLTKLTESGMNRERAYELVQGTALDISKRVSLGNVGEKEFLKALLAKKEIKDHIDEKTLSAIFEPSRYLTYLDIVFKRVFEIDTVEYHRKKDEPTEAKVPALFNHSI